MFDLEALAADCVGWRYEHAGRKAGAVDCFGLFLYLAKAMGFDIPDYEYSKDWRDENYFEADYWKYGDPVEAADARPGDVILLWSRGAHISHIGIVLKNGRFIHCTENGVAISRYTRQPFNRRVAMFCRLRASG